MLASVAKADSNGGVVVSITTVEQARQEIKRDGPMVVMYHAEWCGACQAFMPTYVHIAMLMPDVRFYLIDMDNGAGYKEHVKLHDPFYIPWVIVGMNEDQIRNHPCQVAKNVRTSSEVSKQIRACLKKQSR
jgi:thiol-disulfide isomerase/thioredoxin